jgi:hypothetical protein
MDAPEDIKFILSRFIKSYIQEFIQKGGSPKDAINAAIFEYTFREPSKEFCIKFSLDNRLYKEWALPINLSRAENQIAYQYFIDIHNGRSILQYYAELLELNPELKSILNTKIDENNAIKFFPNILAIVDGAISSFNFDDINEFVNIGHGMIPRGEEYDAQRKAVEEKINSHMGWIPSYKTLQIIYDSINKH